MDISCIKRPEDWPFDMPEFLIKDINALLDGYLNGSPYIDLLRNEIAGSARALSEENDALIRNYYAEEGWRDECAMD